MGLSSCEKCWDTPCVCGHEYRFWTDEALTEQINMLQNIINERKIKKEPDAEKEQNDTRRFS